MTTKKRSLHIGSRDVELFSALDRTPMTVGQLVQLSVTFARPFNDASNLRRRLRSYLEAGLVRKFSYALLGEGRSPS